MKHFSFVILLMSFMVILTGATLYGQSPKSSWGPMFSQQATNLITTRVVAGINPAASDGVDARDTAAPPPPPSNYLYLYFLLAPDSTLSNYSVDIKRDELSLATAAKVWNLKALTDSTGPISLNLPFATSLPPGFKPTLYNLATGAYQNLRDNPAYTYSATSGVISSFKVLIGDSTKPAVTVTAPAGGDHILVGSSETIAWTSSDGSGLLTHDVYYSVSGAWTLIASVGGSTHSQLWSVPAGISAARIVVVAKDSVMNIGMDSTGVFSIGYTITASAGTNGSITPSGSVFVNDGADQTFNFTPAAHYQVADVVVDGISKGASASYQFTGVTGNHTISVSFTRIIHTISVTQSANGTISPAGTVSVNDGASQTFTITPNSHYQIASVLVDGLPVPNGNYTFTSVIGDHTITASFAGISYTLTLPAVAHGSVTLSPPGGTYIYPANVTLTPTPDAWYDFASWTGDVPGGYGTDNPLTITMDADKSITAHFTIHEYTIVDTAFAGWKLVSVPILQADMSPGGVFEDDYHSTPYYVFAFNPTVGYSSPSLMNMGEGYWLGSNSTKPITAIGPPIAVTTLALSNGFNIVGNPFVTVEPLDNLRFVRGSVVKTWTEAVSSDWLANFMYKYTGSGYAFQYDTMHRWSGYWIATDSDGISIQYNAIVATPAPKIPSPSAESATARQWNVDLAATLVTPEGERYTDEIASCGVRSDARPGFDSRYDAPRPPRGPAKGYVEIGFPVHDKGFPAIFGSMYARLFTGPEQTSWEFVVNTSGQGIVTFKWNKDVLTPLGKDVKIILIDKATHAQVDMKKLDMYTYKETGTSRQFVVRKVDVIIPTSFVLAQNYPNPFNPSTTIIYGLPADAVVTLEIYNTLGQNVTTLVHAEKDQLGYHEVRFDASNMASGLYFYRMNATTANGKSFTISRKMLLIK